MAGADTEVVDPQKLILTIFLLIIIPAATYTRQVLLYSEIDSGLNNEKETGIDPILDIYSGINGNLIWKNGALNIDSNVYHSIKENEFTSWNISLFASQELDNFNFLFSSTYQKDLRDSLSQFKPGFSLLYMEDRSDKHFEINLNTYLYRIDEFDVFSNLNFNPGFLLQKYYAEFAIHHNLNLRSRIFTELSSKVTLISVDYLFKLSFSLQKKAGLNLGFSVNYNLTSHRDIVYPNYLVYDELAFNMNTIFAELSAYYKDLLLRPRISLQQKTYLETAVEERFPEYCFIGGLYADLFLADKILLYLDGFYQIIDDESVINSGYEVTTGIRYQFDLVSGRGRN